MKTKLVRPILVESKLDSEVGIYQGKACYSSFGYTIDDWENHQLILISLDGRIEVGDMVFRWNWFNDIITCDKELLVAEEHGLRLSKVIATQPQLSPDLINQLVDEYNNGGMQDFEIEMEVITEPTQDGNWDKYTQYKPKLTNGFVTFAVTVCDKTDTIGKPLEDYINEKHSQDRCMGFIDGYEARKSEESSNYNDEEVWKLLQDMHLEFVDSKSKISLKQWFDNWFNENKKK